MNNLGLEEFNIELKSAEDYLDAMSRVGTSNKEDCENVKMHLDNINSIVRKLIIPECIVISKCDYGHKAPNKNDKPYEIFCAMKSEDWEK